MRFRKFLPAAFAAGTVFSACAPSQDNPLAPDLRVVSVTVAPLVDTVQVGDSAVLTATVVMSGQGPARPLSWSSTPSSVASVTQSGMVHALTAGSALIIATSANKADTARITAVGAGATSGSHEPAGFRLFNDQPWDVMLSNGWSYLRRASSLDDQIIADATAPHSPVNALQIVFTPDMGTDNEPSVHWLELPGLQEIYTEWWIKVSPNWTCSPAGCGKMTFLFTNGQGQVYTNLYNPPGGQGAPYRVGVNTEWAPYGQQVWLPNATTTPINPGEWHHIEAYYRWETTPGVSGDGIIRWWIDGTLNGDYTSVHYPASNFIEFQFAPTLQNPPATTEYMYIDHTHVSTP